MLDTSNNVAVDTIKIPNIDYYFGTCNLAGTLVEEV